MFRRDRPEEIPAVSPYLQEATTRVDTAIAQKGSPKAPAGGVRPPMTPEVAQRDFIYELYVERATSYVDAGRWEEANQLARDELVGLMVNQIESEKTDPIT